MNLLKVRSAQRSNRQTGAADGLWRSILRVFQDRSARRGPQIRVCTLGDSFQIWPEEDFKSLFGNLGHFYYAANASNVALAGGATLDSYSPGAAQMAKWGTGAWYNIPTSGTAIFGDTTTIGCLMKIYYVKESGAGTFKVETDQNNAGSWTTESASVDASNGSNDIGVVTVTKTSALNYRIRITGLTGSVKILSAAIMENPQSPGSRAGGAYCMPLGNGGGTPTDWNAVGQTQYSAILGDWNPHLIIVKSDDAAAGADGWAANWATLYTKLRTAAPNADFVIVGTHPTHGAPDPAIDPTGSDDFFRKWCSEYDALFVDVRKGFPAYSSATAAFYLESYPNGYHLAEKTGAALMRGMIWRALLPFFTDPTRYGSDPLLPDAGWAFHSGVKGFISSVLSIVNPQARSSETVLRFAASEGSNSIYGGGIDIGCTRKGQSFNGGKFFIGKDDGSAVGICGYPGIWFADFGFSPFTVGRQPCAWLESMPANSGLVGHAVVGLVGQTANLVEYRTGGSLSSSGTLAAGFDKDTVQFAAKTLTASGTTGAATINKACGRVNFAAAATSLVVTNSLVKARASATVGSTILLTVLGNDATMTSARYSIAADGAFTIYPNAAPTGEVSVEFYVIN